MPAAAGAQERLAGIMEDELAKDLLSGGAPRTALNRQRLHKLAGALRLPTAAERQEGNCATLWPLFSSLFYLLSHQDDPFNYYRRRQLLNFHGLAASI